MKIALIHDKTMVKNVNIPTTPARLTIPSAAFELIQICSCQVIYSKILLKCLTQRLSAQSDFKACFSETA